MIREEIKKIIKRAARKIQKGKALRFETSILIEEPREKNYGDYSTNIALVLAKKLKKNPLEIAEEFKSEILNSKPGLFQRVEVAKPGFINFFIKKGYLQRQVKNILREKEKFGSLKIGRKQKVNIEFISANPTGPLTLGNGRGGFCGDVLANVLEKAGFRVIREYYINDIGEQIKKLGHSVIGDKEAVYKGKYINTLHERIKGDGPEKVGEKAAKIILEEMIKPIIKKMGIKFDVWFSEKSLYQKKETDKILNYLKKRKLVYEKEKALWFKSTKFGDDKDRVLIKASGEPTYFLSDIAYLRNKFKRGFQKLIFFFGADHYGYIGRMKAAVEALGFKKEQADFIIMQLVRLFREGKEIRMSKRKGIYVTLEDLINEIGLDVARFFFLMRAPTTHLVINLDLAKERTQKNPVFYVQYAHARICSIIEKIKNQKSKMNKFLASESKITNQNLKLLNHPSELGLIKKIIRLPEIIEDTAKDYQVQRLPHYAIELADSFHKFYESCRVITSDKNLSMARLGLVLATRIVLKNTLELMGISAPEKM